jgi:hypothetical protein
LDELGAAARKFGKPIRREGAREVLSRRCPSRRNLRGSWTSYFSASLISTRGADGSSRADAARKATAEFAIFTALSMLIGAFIASAAAAYGGSVRAEL